MSSIEVDRKDGLSSSTAAKGPCRAATTANVALYGMQTIDGVALAAGDRVLVKAQTAGYENGIYVCDTGQWRRAKDFSRNNDVREGTFIIVAQGNVAERSIWCVTSVNPVTVGTDSITFEEIVVSAAELEALESSAVGAANTAVGAAATAVAAAASINLPAIAANHVIVDNAAGTARESIDFPTFRGRIAALARAVSVATLALLAPVQDSVAFVTAAGNEGEWVQRPYASYSAVAALDTVQGYVIRSTVDPTKVFVRRTTYLTPEMFGAAGNDATNDVAAFRLVAAVSMATGIPVVLGAKTYLWQLPNATEIWDFTSVYASGFAMYGAGPGLSNIHITGITTVGLKAWQIKSTADWYRLSMRNFSVIGAMDNTLFTVGQDNYIDPLNLGDFYRVEVKNSFLAGTQTEAWRLNYVVNSEFIGCVGNCYANGSGTNYGTALRIRQSSFNTFVNGSYGNAQYGVRFTDSTSYGNTFLSPDHENVSFSVSNDSSTALRNTWVGGTFSLWTSFAIQSTNADTTASTLFINCNFNNGAGPATVLSTINYVGVKFIDGRSVASPAFPASATTVANTSGKTVTVRLGGGAYTVVSVNGFGMSFASTANWTEWTLPPGQTIAVTFTSAPTWSWIAT